MNRRESLKRIHKVDSEPKFIKNKNCIAIFVAWDIKNVWLSLKGLLTNTFWYKQVVTSPDRQHEWVEINEGDSLISMFLKPIIAPMRSSIVYPDFRVNNFQIRANWINLTSNTPIYSLAQETPNTYISRFLKKCQNFHVPGVNEDVIKLQLFSYTLLDATLEALLHGKNWLENYATNSSH